MGNQVDKTHGGRGQALGSSKDPPPSPPKSKSKLSKFKKKKKQPTQHPIYHSQAEQRAARSKLVTKKQVNVQSELNKKEKMLHIMESADAVAQGQKAPEAPKHMQYNKNNPSQSLSPKSKSSATTKNNGSASSLYMADPSSKEALAAEARIKQKTLNKAKNKQERKDRTMDLLFGDGLKQKEEEYDASKYNDEQFNANKSGAGSNNKDAMFYKSDKDVPLSSNSNTAKAALARFGQQKKWEDYQSEG